MPNAEYRRSWFLAPIRVHEQVRTLHEPLSVSRRQEPNPTHSASQLLSTLLRILRLFAANQFRSSVRDSRQKAQKAQKHCIRHKDAEPPRASWRSKLPMNLRHSNFGIRHSAFRTGSSNVELPNVQVHGPNVRPKSWRSLLSMNLPPLLILILILIAEGRLRLRLRLRLRVGRPGSWPSGIRHSHSALRI